MLVSWEGGVNDTKLWQVSLIALVWQRRNMQMTALLKNKTFKICSAIVLCVVWQAQLSGASHSPGIEIMRDKVLWLWGT